MKAPRRKKAKHTSCASQVGPTKSSVSVSTASVVTMGPTHSSHAAFGVTFLTTIHEGDESPSVKYEFSGHGAAA